MLRDFKARIVQRPHAIERATDDDRTEMAVAITGRNGAQPISYEP